MQIFKNYQVFSVCFRFAFKEQKTEHSVSNNLKKWVLTRPSRNGTVRLGAMTLSQVTSSGLPVSEIAVSPGIGFLKMFERFTPFLTSGVTLAIFILEESSRCLSGVCKIIDFVDKKWTV